MSTTSNLKQGLLAGLVICVLAAGCSSNGGRGDTSIADNDTTTTTTQSVEEPSTTTEAEPTTTTTLGVAEPSTTAEAEPATTADSDADITTTTTVDDPTNPTGAGLGDLDLDEVEPGFGHPTEGVPDSCRIANHASYLLQIMHSYVAIDTLNYLSV